MKKTGWSKNLLVAAALTALLTLSLPPAVRADTLGDLARQAKKPLVADFGMRRCGQCIAQGKIMEEVGAAVGEKVLTRFVHIKDEEAVTEEYKVLMVPTIIFFDSEGKELYRNVGLMQKEAILNKLGELGLFGK